MNIYVCMCIYIYRVCCVNKCMYTVSLCSTQCRSTWTIAFPYCTILVDSGVTTPLGKHLKSKNQRMVTNFVGKRCKTMEYSISNILIMDSLCHELASVQSVGVSQCDLHFPNLGSSLYPGRVPSPKHIQTLCVSRIGVRFFKKNDT